MALCYAGGRLLTVQCWLCAHALINFVRLAYIGAYSFRVRGIQTVSFFCSFLWTGSEIFNMTCVAGGLHYPSVSSG